MNSRRKHPPAIAGAKAGFNTATAYRFEKEARAINFNNSFIDTLVAPILPRAGTALETFEAVIAFETSIA